jgi:hypothetical protein
MDFNIGQMGIYILNNSRACCLPKIPSTLSQNHNLIRKSGSYQMPGSLSLVQVLIVGHVASRHWHICDTIAFQSLDHT